MGPHTISDPVNSKSNRFRAFIYSRKLVIRELQFSGPDCIVEPNMHRVRCCHCSKVWSNRRSNDTTSSLYIRHIHDEHKNLPSNAREEEEHISKLGRPTKRQQTEVNPWTTAATCHSRKPGEKFVPDIYQELLITFVVQTNSPFSIVESKSFRQLLQYCNSQCPKISRRTVTTDLQKLQDKLQLKTKASILEHVNTGCRINLTLDTWTASNKIPYLGITVHWLDSQFVLHDVVLDFIRLRGSHTAQNLAEVVQTLQLYGLTHALGCITADNASVNNKLFQVLEDALPNWTKRDGHIRCMAHVINL